jgi:hypothetical protein
MTIRRRTALAALLALATGPALAQGTPGSRNAAEAGVQQEILALRDRIRAAIATKDRAALDKAYADNFAHLRDSGRSDMKEERIALLLSGESTIETEPEENMVVQIYGPATAIATGVSPIKDRETNRLVPFRWLSVYVRQGDSWQVAVSQATRVQAAAPQRRR